MPSQGPLSPGTIIAPAWSTADNAKVEDGSFAYQDISPNNASGEMLATNFSFTVSPGAWIVGIKMSMKRNESASNIQDYIVRVLYNSTYGTNLSTSQVWGTALNYFDFGGSTNRCGCTGINTSHVNNSSFGVMIYAFNADVSAPHIAQIDHIRMTVYFSKRKPQIMMF